MTAQIAILSKNGIALASDSAVTVQRERGQKTYNTVNKLFTLSKYAPIGTMIFGNAEFMGVPWEVIIKSYRQQLGCKTFDHLENYAEDLFEFIQKNEVMFPKTHQRRHFLAVFGEFLSELKEEIDQRVGEALKERSQLSDGEIRQIVSSLIRASCLASRNTKTLPQYTRSDERGLITDNEEGIRARIEEVLQKLPISRHDQVRLRMIAAHLVTKEEFHPSYSGIVIAGYGNADHFAKLRCFHVEAVLGGKVKRKTKNSVDISDSKSAILVPFAQSDMVSEFMEGVHPTFVQFVQSYLGRLFAAFPKQLIDSIDGMAQEQKDRLEASLAALCRKLMQDMDKERKVFQHETHVKPVVDTIGVLPKEELATMAEALVNLTQFRQKITLQLETVGGPVDVAVLSKGDGFIWIRRKHYFKPELNHHFEQNYFR